MTHQRQATVQNQNFSFKHERYETLGELGRGGMGVVLRCRDNQLLRDVAVKILSWNISSKDAVRFHKEAIALAKMKHPNILTILDFGQSNSNELYIVLELLSGENLADLIASGEEISLDEALSTFIQLCDGLAHAHGRDILHRDIKPSNVFLERTASGDLKPVITDFGLAKLLSEDQHLTKTGVGIGSPPYMSPEQANGQTVDERSDIYSLGCLMFEMLTGEPPFLGETIPQTLLLHVNSPVPKLSDKTQGKTYSDELEKIIARCLQKDADRRYQTVSALRTDLMNYRSSLFANDQAEIENSGIYRPSSAFLESITPVSAPETSSRSLILWMSLVAITGLALFGWFVSNSLTKPEDFKIQDGNKVVTTYKDDPSIDRALNDGDPWKHIQGPDWRKKFKELRNTALLEDRKMNLLPMYIDADDTGLNDDDLSSIDFIPIRGLRLNGTQITDKGLESLKDEGSLKEIYLVKTRVTDAGIRNLKNLPHLTYIHLDNTAVTDETIKSLSTCPEISTISLKFCNKIKGSSLDSLARSVVYTSIALPYTSTEHKNLKKLRSVRVEGLDLAGLNLTDSDLDSISGIRNVIVLNITNNPKITGKGLLKLTKMPDLNLLILDHLRPEELKQFAQQRPDVRLSQF